MIRKKIETKAYEILKGKRSKDEMRICIRIYQHIYLL